MFMTRLVKNIVLSILMLNGGFDSSSCTASDNPGTGYYHDPSQYPQLYAYPPYYQLPPPTYVVPYTDHGRYYGAPQYPGQYTYQPAQPTYVAPALVPTIEQQYPTLAKTLTFIQDEAMKKQFWVEFQINPDYQKFESYAREQVFICRNIENIRVGINYEELVRAATIISQVINNPDFNEVRVMTLLAVMPDAELNEVIAAYSSHKEVGAEKLEGEAVQLRTEPNLTDHLKSLREAAMGKLQGLPIIPPEKPYQRKTRTLMDAFASYSWLSQENINGFGSSLIVVDLEFEKDSATDMIPFDFFINYDSAEIAHGSLVSACAASMDPKQRAIAYGAKILPICAKSSEFKYLEETDKIFSNIDIIKKLIGSSIRAEDTKILLSATKVLLDTLKMRREAKPGMPQFERILNLGMLECIEKVLVYCRSNKLPLPRLINMSLSFIANLEESDALVDRLIRILNENDMLMIVSAGNDGKDTGSAAASKEEIDIRGNLQNYPELAKRLIITGASGLRFDPQDYSNLAGDALEHTIFAFDSILDPSILNADHIIYKKCNFTQGTSFASPRVAGLAVVLGKYFPQLTMIQIKDLILKSAFKPDSNDLKRLGLEEFDPKKLGHGGIYPRQAWLDACKLIGMKG
jgi:hypothetical protein